MNCDFNNFPKHEYQKEITLRKKTLTSVYLMNHLSTGNRVVVKKLKESTEIPRENIFFEAKTGMHLSHPNFAKTIRHYVNPQKHKHYLVIEHIPGITLARFLSQNNTIPLEDVKKIYVQLLSALKYCFEENIFPADCHSENIIIETTHLDKKVTFIDFGKYIEMSSSEDMQCGNFCCDIRGQILSLYDRIPYVRGDDLAASWRKLFNFLDSRRTSKEFIDLFDELLKHPFLQKKQVKEENSLFMDLASEYVEDEENIIQLD